MKTIVVTQHEINQATRPNVYKNKKKYTRKVGKVGDWFKQSFKKIRIYELLSLYLSINLKRNKMKKKLKIIGVFLNPYILWIIIYAILLGIGALILS